MVAPLASAVPARINTQGFDSYRVFGVQRRMRLVYASARAGRHFVTMTQYAFFTYFGAFHAHERLAARASAHAHRARLRLRAHAGAHFFRGFRRPRTLRGGEPRAPLLEH